jgi:transcriptional regulator of acetoin/glycerol metabolism
MEKHHIQRFLLKPGILMAARILGIDIATLWRKRKKFGI